MILALFKKVWQFLINLNTHPPFQPAMILLDITQKTQQRLIWVGVGKG